MVACSTRHHPARSMVLLLSHGTFQSRRHPQPLAAGKALALYIPPSSRPSALPSGKSCQTSERAELTFPSPAGVPWLPPPLGGVHTGPSWHIPGGLLGAGQEDLAEAVVREGEPLRAFVLRSDAALGRSADGFSLLCPTRHDFLVGPNR